MRRDIFEKDQPVHIISRAVDERKIFDKEIDCFRYVFQIYAANIGKPTHVIWRQDVIKIANAILNGEEISSKFIVKEHVPLVHILDFSLVVNHEHFYLVPNIRNSIPIFMKKLNNGFAQYFNLKYHRKGALFSGPYRAVVIKSQRQSDTVSRYVGLINTLDVFQPGWRKTGLENKENAFKFLKNYHFSSFPDKVGERKSKILAPQDVLEKYLTIGPKETNNYRQFAESFLDERLNMPQELLLE